jgi:hypothetical protein
MAKPPVASGYDQQVTENCERVLVTLLRGLGHGKTPCTWWAASLRATSLPS